MASKKNSKSSQSSNKTGDTVAKIVSQAKESLKVLEALEKETINQIMNAKNLVKIPNAEERKRMTNDKIISSLRKLGVATQSEVDALNARIETLENTINSISNNNGSKATHTRANNSNNASNASIEPSA